MSLAFGITALGFAGGMVAVAIHGALTTPRPELFWSMFLAWLVMTTIQFACNKRGMR